MNKELSILYLLFSDDVFFVSSLDGKLKRDDIITAVVVVVVVVIRMD